MLDQNFYDPLKHSPQENQQHLITLVEEMQSLLIEMQHGEEDFLQASKDTRAMLLAAVSEAGRLLKSAQEYSVEAQAVVDYGFQPEHLL
ncbi:hypothetical protein [Nostoc favosum]|uniref:Uncharacterized protein n=1 Tax=Nostoc favosum CHAB5714 TaxID=2780399 RepID=A0ABS8IIZ0_9NOSO|nr:hypothetical protein [Nostoc favosum]MCC5604265.1 hypothetical protein [Nostoc favosum CHAB5714]